MTHHGAASTPGETLTHHGAASTPGETMTHHGLSPAETLTHSGEARSTRPVDSVEPGWAPGAIVEERWEVFGAARGGMGQVYFVRDRGWGNATLAVKSLLAHGNPSPERLATSRKLFRRETQVWLDLGAHQNIVSGFYTLEVGGVLRFFMEYVAGQSLADIVAPGELELPRALDLAIQLCAGMQYVHVRDVVHRDLKPANCLVMEDDTLRVTDFGLGKAVTDLDAAMPAADAAHDAGLSQHGAGTPYYMAPEQWSSLAEAHKPADVYAFGVILYELLGAGRPFTSEPAVLRRYDGRVPPLLQQLIDGGAPIEQLVLRMFHQQATPFALSTVRPELPPALQSIAQACLSKQPAERPGFGAVRDELIRCYTQVTGHPYRRQLPDALEPSEAGENNRAVSYYTMGNHAKAKSILDAWLVNDPKALYPWINRHSIALRHAEIEPADVADRFARELVRSHPGAFDGSDGIAAYARAVARYRFEHPAKVLSVAVSPDGATIATGCEDRSVRVFDAATGELLARHEHDDLVLAVAFGANGTLAAGNGAAIAIYDRAGKLKTKLAGHTELVTSLAVAGDGTLWSASNDRTARSWDIGARRERVQLKKHGEIVRSVTTSGHHVATCSFDGQVRVWTSEGQLVRAFGEAGTVQTIARFASDGRTLWTGGNDGVLRRWDFEAGALVGSYREHTGGLAALAVAGDHVATAGVDQIVRLWDARTGQVLRRWLGHRAAVRALQFVDATRLVTASDDHTARLWSLEPLPAEHWPLHIRRDAAVGGRRELEREKRALIARAERGDAVLSALREFRGAHEAYRRDDELLASEHALGKQRGIPVGCRDAFVAWTATTGAPVVDVAFSRAGDSVYAATEAELWRYAVDRRTRPQRIANVTAPVACMVSDDGAHVLSAGANGIAVWSAAATDVSELARSWERGALHHAAFAGNGSVVVAGGWSRGALRASWQAQGLLRAWRFPSGEEIKFKHKGHAALAVAVSSDGGLIAAGMDDGELALWDVERRTRSTAMVPATRSPITAVALSATKRLAASGGEDGTVCLWRLDTGALVGSAAHRGRVTSLSFSDDDGLLASSVADGTVSLFLCQPLRQLRVLEGHAETATIAFGPGGRQLVSGGRDRLLRVWTLDLDWPL